MHADLLDLLRCPFCGSRLSLLDNDALIRVNARVESGVLGCTCCAFPIVAGIPVMIADDTTRRAMHQMEAGQHEDALFTLLGLEAGRGASLRALLAAPNQATYREAITILSPDAEGVYLLYRFSDPTYLVAQAVLQGLGKNRWAVERRVLDLCGGSGHLTRVLEGLEPTGGTVLADGSFWKLWLAKRFTAPGCEPVCCDANSPLPLAHNTFSMVVLADAFHYIWHKRLLAGEMMRLVGPDGVIVLPHLHSALGENFSEGMTLPPPTYQDLFEAHQPRLFSDRKLLTGVLEGTSLDLAHGVSAAELGDEPSLTLIASHRTNLFRQYELPRSSRVIGELRVNPLYRVEHDGPQSVLTMSFPTPEYEAEFSECKRYLPAEVTVTGDLSGALGPAFVGEGYEDLRRRRILIDVPPQYC